MKKWPKKLQSSNLFTHVDDDIRVAGMHFYCIAYCKISASFNSKFEKTQNTIVH